MNCSLQRVSIGVGSIFLAGLCPGTEPTVTVKDETSQVKAEIQAGLPRFGESEKAPEKPAAPDPQELQMAAHIKRLPQRQSRPPRGDEILTAKGKAEAAMNQYLGKSDGFDRGVLNRFTLPQLWQKIPLLKYLPCPLPGMTNEARAAIQSDIDYPQALRDEADLNSLSGSGPRDLPRSTESP